MICLCLIGSIKEGRADIPPFGAYAQLMVPRYFSEFKKLLYLEVDQIVQKDLSSLWHHVYSEGIVLGAVRNLNGETGEYIQPNDENFTSKYPGATYFNTGVFLFDTNYWESNSLEDLCLSYVAKQRDSLGNEYMYYAQGAINHALASTISSLKEKYNWTGLGYRDGIPSAFLNNASILHWNGPSKPWISGSNYQSYYLESSGITRSRLDELFLLDLKVQRNLGDSTAVPSRRARVKLLMNKLLGIPRFT